MSESADGLALAGVARVSDVLPIDSVAGQASKGSLAASRGCRIDVVSVG